MKRLLGLAGALLLGSNLGWGMSGEEIVRKAIESEKRSQEVLRTYQVNLEIRKEKLDRTGKLTDEEKSSSFVNAGTLSDREMTLSSSAKDLREDQKTIQAVTDYEALLPRFDFKLTGTEKVGGIKCYRVSYEPKSGQPYKSREEKVLNQMAGTLWIDQSSFAVIRNSGTLSRPVEVAWIFATVREIDFHYDAKRVQRGVYGPKDFSMRIRIAVPFMQIHERHGWTMSDYGRL